MEIDMQVPSGPTSTFGALVAGQTFFSGNTDYIKTDSTKTALTNATCLANGQQELFTDSATITPQAQKAVAL